jgi:hypothetical protein
LKLVEKEFELGYLDYGECGEYAKSVVKSENESDMNDSNTKSENESDMNDSNEIENR